MSSPLDRVSHWLVTDENPPREVDGMDAERCTALHNAIFEHGWLKAGRTHEEWLTESKTWWEHVGQAADDNAHRLHPSLQAFLHEARILPYHMHQLNFFYHLIGLSPWLDFWNELEADYEDDMFLTLYHTNHEFSSHAMGLGYDQHRHLAMMRWSITDGNPFTGGWDFPEGSYGEKLECVLTVYINMIERGKVVALPHNVGRDPEWIRSEDGEFRQTIVGPEKDPETGASRRDVGFEPWTIVPWAQQDLEECLEFWDLLVATIERRLPIESANVERSSIKTTESSAAGMTDLTSTAETHNGTGFYPEATLVAAGIPANSFIHDFLMRARQPRFTYVAPGLRLQTPEEFVTHPFLTVHEQQESQGQVVPGHVNPNDVPAILLFCESERAVTSSDAPVGLYVDSYDSGATFPFGDACKLTLPFTLNDNGHARRSDQRSLVDTNDSLFQSGLNPFIEMHGVQLQAVLESMYENVESGYWAVDEHGVAGGIDVWKDADTAERWLSYWTPVGPGKYW